ncbi:MAG: hypothetical protein ACO2O1_10580, partial [Candidatus Caldarchaeales archaeon]
MLPLLLQSLDERLGSLVREDPLAPSGLVTPPRKRGQVLLGEGLGALDGYLPVLKDGKDLPHFCELLLGLRFF